VNSIRLRQFGSLLFSEPGPFLLKLRELEHQVARSNLPERMRQLRTNELKPWRELREAALFAYFMGERIGVPVLVARGEAQDYDFVVTWESKSARNYAPIQIKEVVPADINPAASVLAVIDSLSKYGSSSDLTVVIHLNQRTAFDPRTLQVPKLPIGALWMFGAVSPDSNHWALWGDFLVDPFGSRHEYPTG
jgi:hypothetical protein